MLLFSYNDFFMAFYDLSDNFINFTWSQLNILQEDTIIIL